MKLSKTMLFASAALMCASCTGKSLTTFVKMGWSVPALLGQLFLTQEGDQYTVVKYKFASKGEYTLKATDFTITVKDQNKDFTGIKFLTKCSDIEHPFWITESADELTLDNEMFVMYDQNLGYDEKNVTGKIKNTSNIPLLQETSITFKK